MNAQDILKYGDSFLQNTLDGLPMETWETGGVCGVWSVKDIVAHLASYELMLNDVLSGFLGSTEMPTLQAMMQDPAHFGDNEVNARKGKSAEAVLQEYQAGHAKNMELAAQISPEKFREVGTLPWYGAEYSLDDYIVYSFYGHKREHGAQIDVFKDRVNGQ